MNIEEISAAELKQRREADATLRVIDVREPWEIAIASLPGTLNIPLNELPQRLGQLDPKAETVVMCKAGSRSRHAAAYLLSHGFERVANLSGGIDAWTRDIDPNLASY